MIDSIKQLLQQEAQAVLNIPITDAYEKAVKLIVEQIHQKKGKLVTSGMGKAGQIAMNIATTFCSTGIPSVFLHPSEAQHGDLGILQKNDLLLLISNSGKTREIVELTRLAHNLDPDLKFIVITGNPDSPLAKESDVCLSTGKPAEVCVLGMTPTTSTTAMTVIGDILVVQTMKETGFTIAEYSKRHHGGYRGKKIKITMRKVIGIGETILDIIFRGDQPSAAVPGGSVFNGIVSLGRMGVNVGFISETGNDRVGNIILQFMRENNIPTDHVNVFPDGKSPVSLAFLNEQSDAEYIFYKNYPKQRLDVLFPKLEEDDIVMVGSYYALNPVLREKILELLDQAREKKAIIYYDPNFRSSHKNEAIKLAPTIIENLEYADIVRGSLEDFLYMYNIQDVDKIYKDKIKFYCPRFICTAGGEKVALRTNLVNKDYPVEPLQAVSTIGAGDNFNAGLIYGLLKYDVRYRDLNNLNEDIWDKIIQCGKDFAAEVCGSFSNSVSVEFAKKYR